MEGLVTVVNPEDVPAGREIWILRHGQTKANAKDVIRGWWDLPLDEVGFEQARDLGEALFKENIEMDGIYVSDLMRSVQTAIEISKIAGYPILGTTRTLRPWDVGELTGTDGKKAHAVMSDYSRNKPDEQLAGGESFDTFRYRFLGGLVGMLNSNRGLKIGFVSHSRGERILHGWVAAGCPEDFSLDMDVFLAPGEGTATAQQLVINCPLILP